ncbi:hypothetical protein F2P79_005646 [Pimephales promelas]|nr:hypothetical protein F2P79_005646 [Pimephales promelas]
MPMPLPPKQGYPSKSLGPQNNSIYSPCARQRIYPTSLYVAHINATLRHQSPQEDTRRGMSDPKTAFQKMKRLIVLLLRYALIHLCSH